MLRHWKQGLWLLAAGFLALTIVADLEARPFRRRAYRNGGYGTYSTGYHARYGTAGAGVNVTAPGVGVTAGPGGASVVAPGVGVNAGIDRAAAGTFQGGANINAPGVNVGVGAGTNAARDAADANVRVRGQTPDIATPPAP